VPGNMTENKLAYIQNSTISKNCTRTLKVVDRFGVVNIVNFEWTCSFKKTA
jgi:hypothetical protein